MSRYADLKEKRISTLTNQHSYKVSQFHKTLKANSGQNLSKLQVSVAPFDGSPVPKAISQIEVLF